jgi:hypothetical protein
MHMQAQREWSGSQDIRQRYPTFVHYWRERYERVYRLDFRPRRAPGDGSALSGWT